MCSSDLLNQEGQISALGKPFAASMIKWIRYRYQIPTAQLVRPEELTVPQMAKRFGVSPNVVYYWIDRAVIQARRLNAGSPYWITLHESDEQKRELSAVNRLIVAEEVGPVERRYSFPVGILFGR